MVRFGLRKQRRHSTDVKKRRKKMPEATVTDTLDAVRRLLREGRTTEADVQLDALQEKLRIEAEQQKNLKPPPGKRTLVELQIDFADTVCDLLGNPPRLINLLVEIKGELEEHPEQ
jgi:hypothetical protein